MRWAFRLCNVLRLCSINTFFNVETKFSHLAVDAPNVSACLNAVITAGMALNIMYYFDTSWLKVTRRTWTGLSTPRSSGKPRCCCECDDGLSAPGEPGPEAVGAGGPAGSSLCSLASASPVLLLLLPGCRDADGVVFSHLRMSIVTDNVR